MADVHYHPGTWFGLVSEQGIALLPDRFDEQQLTTVWGSFTAGGGLPGILDALTRALGVGLEAIPPFLVATLDGECLRIAVRGSLHVEVAERIGDTRTVSIISGAGVTTWVERAVDRPLSISVSAGAGQPTEALSLPISRGVVLASMLTADFGAGTPDAGDGGTAPHEQAREEDEPVRSPPQPPATHTSVLGETQVPDVTRPVDSDATEGDHDGATISVAELRAMQAAASASENAASPTAASPADAAPDPAPDPAARVISDSLPNMAARGHIEVSTGETAALDGPIVIGRRPQALRVGPQEIPHLIMVPSPQHDISRSHLEIRVEGIHVVVRDLSTTNGSVLKRPGTPPLRLQAETPTLVVSRDVIDIGDGITVTFVDLP